MRVLIATASALCYLHNELNVCHGDVYGHNVLSDASGEHVSICDFGASFLYAADQQVLWERVEVRNQQRGPDRPPPFACPLIHRICTLPVVYVSCTLIAPLLRRLQPALPRLPPRRRCCQVAESQAWYRA